jgi:hypothetical protein
MYWGIWMRQVLHDASDPDRRFDAMYSLMSCTLAGAINRKGGDRVKSSMHATVGSERLKQVE